MGDRRWLDLRFASSVLAPAAAGWLAASLPFSQSGLAPIWRGGLAAVIAALVVTVWHTRRVRDLAHWAQRVRGGEHVTPPLVVRGPDTLDHLGSELRAMAERLAGEVVRLEDERDRLEAILAGMAEGVIVVDAAGVILRSNEPVRRIFGLGSNETVAGRRLWDVSRDVDLNAAVREAVAAAGATFREIDLRGAVQRQLHMTAGPTADRSAWVLVFHDITEIRRLERVRTDFVANVSHELRTPLTAIKGFAETLASMGFEDRARAEHFVAIIVRQAGRLSRLIDDLLSLSDLELGKTAFELVPTRLRPVVDEVVELLGESARRGSLGVSVGVSEEIAVRGDGDRLSQVVSNLLENAIKYTPPGGQISVSAVPRDDWVDLVVRDTGVGVPAEDLPRLAERFYRVDKARSSELGGTGLGLSIVKHIVQAHGGELGIESRLGAGTTVTISLPGADASSSMDPVRMASGARTR